MQSSALLTLSMVIVAVGDAIVYALVFSLSLEIFPDLKGVVSSAIMSLRAFLIFAFVGLMGNVYNDDLSSYAFVCLLIFAPTAYCLIRLYQVGFLDESTSAGEQNVMCHV